MKIAIAQLNYIIGDFDGNLKKMQKAVEEAKTQQADLICFSELATCGYPPRDFLEFNDFIHKGEKSIYALCEMAQDIAIFVGSPSVNPVPEGKDLYNSVYFLFDGKVQYVQHKTLLPTYDVFDEYRYFEPNKEFGIVAYKGVRFALTVCEDIWNIGNENPLYTVCPLDEMQKYHPDVVLNASASPFSYKHAEDRLYILKKNAERYKLPIFYINHIGAQTEIIFDGGSVIMSPDGRVYDEMPYFVEDMAYYELADVVTGRDRDELEKDAIPLIYEALVLGIQDYFGKLHFKKAILGLSGGIDSALTLVLAVRALGNKNVTALLMPSEYSSDHSVDDAVQLAEKLGVLYEILPIKELYQTYNEVLQPHFAGRDFDVTEENLQARIRGALLMAFSNKFGSILLNTTNKSEMAVGYGTLYGDLNGGLSVLGDVYKMQVFALSNFINAQEEIIPWNTIRKPPSAELRPNQKDSDSLPAYEDLDEILFHYIEKRKGPKEIIALGYEPALVNRILKLVNINEFKRYQTAPVLRVSNKSFGMGRRMPIVGRYLS